VNDEIQAVIDRQIRDLTPGMLISAAMTKHYYTILLDTGLPESIIIAAVSTWLRARERLEIEPILHHIYMQQHAAHDGEGLSREGSGDE
jgi:hypothetical protein